MEPERHGHAFTVSVGNSKQQDFKIPFHILQKMEFRNKKHIKTTIHDITGTNTDNDTDPIQRMMDEMINRLCITENHLSPNVLIDMIALIIRSYLTQELHIQLSQPLRYFIHSPFHPFDIALFPPRKQGITHPLVFNDKIQFQPLIEFQLDNYAFGFASAVFIGTDAYRTLIISTPSVPCLCIQSYKPLSVISEIEDGVIYLWKQGNAAYILTRKRSSVRLSRIQLYMITVSGINGKVFVNRLIDQSMKLSNGVDFRISSAYYYTQCVDSEQKQNDPISKYTIRNGFPSDNYLIVVGDLNVIITSHKCIKFKNEVNLRCLWYFAPGNIFIGIERIKYHLVSLGFDPKKKELFIMDRYRQIKATGIQHCFYDVDKDMIVIYKQLMASSTFTHELIFLPVSSQLMIPEPVGI